MFSCCSGKVPDKRQLLRGVPPSNLKRHYGSPQRDAAWPKTLSFPWSAEDSHSASTSSGPRNSFCSEILWNRPSHHWCAWLGSGWAGKCAGVMHKYFFFQKVTWMAAVIEHQVNESHLMGYIKLPNKSRWWKFNWVLLKSYYRLPTLLFFLPTLPLIYFSLFFCLASEEWGLWIVASWFRLR